MTLVIMLITFICGIIILVTDRKSASSKWLSLILFFASLASFANALQDFFPVFVYKNLSIQLSGKSLYYIDRINAFLTQLSEHVICYFFFMYCVYHSGLFNRKTRYILGLVLFAITMLFFFSFPITTNQEKFDMHIYADYYRLLALWSIPAVISASAFLCISTYKEKNLRIKNQRKRNLIIILPVVVSIIINLYILRALGLRLAWQYNEITIFLAFLFFLYFSFKYGVMGVKIKVEKQFLLSVLSNIFSGTAIFNHTLKNEIIKISMSTDNINNNLVKNEIDLNQIKENLEVISHSTEYLMKMVKRIQDFSKEIKIHETVNYLPDLINSAIGHTKIFIYQRKIKVVADFNYELYISCDAMHITEVIINILKNACEATSENGTITIKVYGNRKLVNIAISDTGTGIKKEHLSKIFEPFFTTKHNDENFGLGLSYCFNVMQKHNCDLNIFSEEGKGTTFFLSFPSFRIMKFDDNIKEGGMVIEKNKDNNS